MLRKALKACLSILVVLLAEKYRPKRLEDVQGHDSVKQRLRRWIEAWLKGKKQKPILLYGKIGIGKSSLAYALANEYKLDAIVVSPSQACDASHIKNLMPKVHMRRNLWGQLPIIIFDDIQALSGQQDRGAIPAVIQLIKESQIPILLTAEDPWDPKLRDLREKVELVQMRKLSSRQVLAIIKRIAASEHIKISDEALKQIAEASDGDARAAINDLQVESVGYRERQNDIFATLRTIFKTTSLKSSVAKIRSSDTDLDTIKMWLDENIAKEYEKGGEVAKAFDYLSRADVFEGRIHSRQYWGFLRYVALLVAAVSVAKKEPYHKYTKYTYPQYIKEMFKTVMLRRKIKEVCAKIGRRLHLSPGEVWDDFPIYGRVVLSDKEKAKAFYRLGDDELEFIESLIKAEAALSSGQRRSGRRF